METIALRYLVVLFTLVVGDAAWLSYFARAMFRPRLGDILLDNPRWGAAALFYLIYAAGLLVFPLALAGRGPWTQAALYGALFGFFAYATYDLTNLATIKAWAAPLALVDIGWGAFLTALACVLGGMIGRTG